MKNTVFLCVVSLFILFSSIVNSYRNYNTVNAQSIINATRVCKPGPKVQTESSKKKCLVIGDSVSIG